MTRLVLLTVAALALSGRATAAPALYNYGPGRVIQWIYLPEDTVCSGQPALVFVGAQHPTLPAEPVDVSVGGWPGSPQIVQHFGAGDRSVLVGAVTRKDRLEDARRVPLHVVDCPAQDNTLEMLVHRNPFNRYRVDFRADFRGRRPARRYDWFFGDGQTATTTQPFVSHEYSPKMKHRDPYTYFAAFVQEGDSGLWSGRQIALASSYDLSRRLGFVQADVDYALQKTGTGYLLGLDVQNRHDKPLLFQSYTKHYLPCDPAEAPRLEEVTAESVFGVAVPVTRPPGVKSPGLVTVPATKGIVGRLTLPFANLPPETCALGFVLKGVTTGLVPVYGSVYFPVRHNAQYTTPVADVETRNTLEELIDTNTVASDQLVTGQDLYLLEQQGAVERTPAGWRLP